MGRVEFSLGSIYSIYFYIYTVFEHSLIFFDIRRVFWSIQQKLGLFYTFLDVLVSWLNFFFPKAYQRNFVSRLCAIRVLFLNIIRYSSCVLEHTTKVGIILYFLGCSSIMVKLCLFLKQLYVSSTSKEFLF